MSHQLTIELHSYWHAGTGRGAGHQLDAVVSRDNLKLPCLPGRSLKGLLREAVTQADELGWYRLHTNQSVASELFGRQSESSDNEQQSRESSPGLLRLGTARLPDGVLAWFQQFDSKTRSPHVERLFTRIYQTAIDRESGTALDKSLRGYEVAIPLTLHATIEPVAPVVGEWQNWPQLIDTALPLLRSIGSQRSRGLGRCTITLKEMP